MRKLVEMEISEHRNASSLGRIRKNLSLSSMNPLKSSDALSLCIKQRTAEINSFPPVARPLPPPQHYPKRSSKASYLTATIAIRFPYRIVDASLDLCARLQVSVRQIKDRAVSILYGPDTDPSCIASAIKAMMASTDNKPVSIPALKVYGQDQKPHTLKVECKPIASESFFSGGQCMLLFEALDDPISEPDASCSLERRQLRKIVRARYNFMVGLEIHLKSCGLAQKTVSTEHCDQRKEEPLSTNKQSAME